MQQDSLTGWLERVADLEEELRKVTQELAEVEYQIKDRERVNQKHKAAKKRDSAALVAKLQELEKEANELTQRMAVATEEKENAESLYHDAMNEYEALHDLVKAIKAEEQSLASRPNLDKIFEQESHQWAMEEHALRDAIQAGEKQLKESRKSHADKLAVLEAKLKERETTLAKDRDQRRTEGWQGGGDEGAATTRDNTRDMRVQGGSRKRPSQSIPLGDRTNSQHH